MNINPIILSIPVFFILIGLELVVDKLRNRSNYRFNDAITNISCGIGEQVTGVFFKLTVVGLYQFLFERYALLDIPVNWTTGIILFIGVDFFYYWFHRYSHVINLFWGGHVVHHQSEEYNLSVALRQGWFQKFFSFGFYLPLAVIGFDPVQFLTVSSLVTLYQFWIHTKNIHKMGVLEYVLNTPSHHRVHHGVNPKYIDKNHGGTFIIWDRMFGTFQEEEEEPTYGITHPINTWDPLSANLHHWKQMYRGIKQMRGPGDKLRYVFMPPGWRPAYISESPAPVNHPSYKKYDTNVSGNINYYVLFQYAITLAGATLFLLSAGKMHFIPKLIACGLIILSIVNYSSLFESKKYALLYEIVRISIAAATLMVYFQLNTPLYLFVIAIWAMVSFFWLYKIGQVNQ
ncbi:MAG: sterol desaturase family protein [Bacteroidia bacterium]|jgi:sterol desaturase/sphingolipid hydroxylase (fatty acid hydroxylase superfamily)